MNDIKVTVYCLAYNHEKYIRSALEGFVNQITNFKYEVIVHDDASTDGTAEIIKEYEEKFPEIIKPIFQTENQYSKHIGIFRTHILPRVNGDYIAVCEGDDYWTNPHKLQMQFDALEEHPECSLSVHKVQCHNEDDTYNSQTIPEERYGLNQNKIISKKELPELYFVRGGYPFHTSSYFFRKELTIDDIGLVRDVGILLKGLAYGEVYYFDLTMSVRRLLTIGNFNQRLITQGYEGKINLFLSNIKNEEIFDRYTNGAYHNYISYSIMNRILRIGRYDIKKSKALLQEKKIGIINSVKIVSLNRKIKTVLKYIGLKCFPIIYKKHR